MWDRSTRASPGSGRAARADRETFSGPPVRPEWEDRQAVKREALIEFGVVRGRLLVLAIWHSFGRRVSVGATRGDFSDRGQVDELVGGVCRSVLDSEGLGLDDVSVNEWQDAYRLALHLQALCPDKAETGRIVDLVRDLAGSDKP